MGSSLVVVKVGDDKLDLLRGAVQEAGLFEQLEARLKATGKSRENFRIAVKPNFMVLTSTHDPSCYTDTELVVALLQELHGQGFTNLHVVESQNVLGNWYENRSVHAVAAAAGYKVNPDQWEGAPLYTVHDLSLDSEPHQYGTFEGLNRVGLAWKNADFRISFGKNKTHPAGVYTLGLKNIFGCTPAENKYLIYHKYSEWDLVTLAMLDAFPVHFGIIDAIWSADGAFGFRGTKSPKRTNTILAAQDLIALDWVGALKMGVDPLCSRLMRKVVTRWGKPQYNVSGPMDRYPDWTNTPAWLPWFDDILEEWYSAHSFCTHCIMLPPDPVFPEPHGWFYRAVRSLFRLHYESSAHVGACRAPST